MDRLTKRDHDSLYYPHCFECCHGHPDADACLSCPFETTIIERLAAYEDTGLEPEEIEALKTGTCLGCSIPESKAHYEQIKRWEDADQQGRLVVLPFALGATLVEYSDPERPERLYNLRISLACDRNGMVFHYPFGIFSEAVKQGYIAQDERYSGAQL